MNRQSMLRYCCDRCVRKNPRKSRKSRKLITAKNFYSSDNQIHDNKWTKKYKSRNFNTFLEVEALLLLTCYRRRSWRGREKMRIVQTLMIFIEYFKRGGETPHCIVQLALLHLHNKNWGLRLRHLTGSRLQHKNPPHLNGVYSGKKLDLLPLNTIFLKLSFFSVFSKWKYFFTSPSRLKRGKMAILPKFLMLGLQKNTW